jgi:SAM-dependent methyltransferase
MTEPARAYTLVDRGDRRVLTVDGREHATRYSAQLLKMLIERKGARRAALYLPFRETRGRHFLGPLFRYLDEIGARDLSVLEVGCSFGHMTEYLDGAPAVGAITTFDTDPAFAEMTRVKVDELRLGKVREVALFENADTRTLPYATGSFDLVVACGVIEHLPERFRRAQVDEYYRVLAPGGHIAVLDTPNRAFPIETHSIGLPLVQWLPPRAAHRYARLARPARFRDVTFAEFTADGTGWRNATLGDCLPSSGWRGLRDVTEDAGYGWRFFRETARSRTRRAVLPLFGVAAAALRAAGRPPSLCLPYLNVLFEKRSAPGEPRTRARAAAAIGSTETAGARPPASPRA